MSNPVFCAILAPNDSRWDWSGEKDWCIGIRDYHYAEAIPITEPDWKSDEYQGRVLARWHVGKISERQRWSDHFGKWMPDDFPSLWGRGTFYRDLADVLAPDPYAELKAAHKAGKVIQAVSDIGRWHDVLPIWSLPVEVYRIKPDPKRVPLEAQDIPAVCWMRENNGPARLVFEVHHGGIFVIHTGFFGWQELSTRPIEYSADRINWQPCSKLVEQ